MSHASTLETTYLQTNFLKNQLEIKTVQANYCKNTANNIKKNFDFIVSQTVTQKGAEIIYNLDSIHRQLRENRENVKLLEKHTKITIDKEYKELLDTKDREINDYKTSFKSFQQEFTNNVHSQLKTNVFQGISELIPYSTKLKRTKIKKILSETKGSAKIRDQFEKMKLKDHLSLLKRFNK